jgi:hypothetical protein
MKKLLNACLFISFLFGYLEWSRVEHLFIFQAEWDIFKKTLIDPVSVLHPFTLIPFAGQILILYSLFQKIPGRIITIVGTACMGILMLMLFIIGMLSLNIKIAGSTLPFLILAFFILKLHWKKKMPEVPLAD